MRHLFIFLLLITLFPKSIAQTNNLQFTTSEVVVGKNIISGMEIKGTRLDFNKKILNFEFDSLSNAFFIWTQKFGDFNKVIAIDNNQYKQMWSIDYNSYRESFMIRKGLIVYVKEENSYRLDSKNGKILWDSPYRFYLTDFRNKIGIGYSQPNYFSDQNAMKYSIAKGVDLSNGTMIWERNIPHKYGWENYRYASDTSLYISSEGLHYVNIKTGKGWDINDITAKDIFTHNLNSEVYIDSLQSYWASSQNLWFFSNSGQINWKIPLKFYVTGETKIFKVNSRYYLLSWGSSHNSYNQDYAYGQSYIAQFSPEKKSITNMTPLNNSEEFVLDYSIKKDTIIVCWPKKLAKYNLQDLSLIKEVKLKQKEKLEKFTGSWRYILDENQKYQSINQIDSINNFVGLATKDNSVISFNSNFERQRTIQGKEIAMLIYRTKNMKLLRTENKIVVINNDGKSVAELNNGYNFEIRNNKLFYQDQDNKNLLIVDLKQLFTE